MVIAFWLGINY